MKTRVFIIVTLLIILTSCSRKTDRSQPSVDHIAPIDATFPLRLDEIDLGEMNGVVLNDAINARITRVVENYYKNECLADSLHSYKDTYVNTIRFYQRSHTVFLVLVKHYPSEWLSSKALFYDNAKKEFLDGEFDFKIYAMYDFSNDKITPSRLKTQLKLSSPEIELIDYDKDGIDDFKLVRLYHNGTFNAIHTAILSVANHKIDTLLYKEEGLKK
jgi:hypothetical protein